MAAALLLLGGAVAPPAAAAVPALGAAQSTGDERDSLQQLLARARRERAAEFERWSDTIGDVVQQLEGGTGTERRLARQRRRLLDLGAGCAPLLVPHLDPGTAPERGERVRAEQITLVLREFSSPTVTTEVITVARAGSNRGRVNALRVLASSPDVEIVGPAVRALFRSGNKVVKQEALRTLAQLGGKEATLMLADALLDKDPDIIDVALEALGEARSKGNARAVLSFAQSDAAASHIKGLLAYYTADPDALEGEHLQALLLLVGNRNVPTSDLLNVLETLRRLELDFDSSHKRAVQPLVDSPNDQVSEAALVVLARARDKTARRRLIKRYDDRVKRQRDYPGVYEDRGTIYYKIGDYKSAVRDYKQAIQLQRDQRVRPKPSGPYLGIARCYALMKRYREAAEALDEAPVSRVTLRELAKEPDFAPMLETRYARSFHLPQGN